MNLILYGFKSCGKTTLGQKVAKSMKCAFYDTDNLVESLYQIKTGQCVSVREIFKSEGEVYFRGLEKQVLPLISNVKNSIIAIGGGLVLDPFNRCFLEQLGKLVYLKVRKKIIQERIFSAGLPGFLDVNRPKESFERLFKKRTLAYEQIPAYRLIIEGQKQDSEIFSELENLLVSYGK
ncbi:shikimate kinase [Candidatus Rhabdochlamydia sp. T3358]|uniref:shikimate kinase n=1 Tax=Candidatus Rhabdochlamydia sp. T3358 TaxID=2099795 RepID=UPI0010BA09C9|nr:shikimate kinase [Candidatus Rhabdochlamydia sp. T3358]VHO03149.1 Shikimate kinase 2 [Candidatus Rhabdochlamydia sp. T3358]